MGIEVDPRGKNKINEVMKRRKEKFEKMSDKEKKSYNREKLNNPYPDSIIHVGPADKEIKRVLAGLDIELAELLLADKLGGVDLVISHHPMMWVNVPEAMELQVDYLSQNGVPVNIADWIMQESARDIGRLTKPLNHFRTMDAVNLLGMALVAPHTPMDLLAFDFIDKILKNKKPEYVEDILDILMDIPEYEIASEKGFGPSLFTGSKENRAGKIVIGFAGGTSPSHKIYEKMSQAGIGTLIGMHIHEDERKEAEKYHINVVVAGHVSSDSLGTNLFLDEIEKKGIEVIPCSGLIRVKRFSAKG